MNNSSTKKHQHSFDFAKKNDKTVINNEYVFSLLAGHNGFLIFVHVPIIVYY